MAEQVFYEDVKEGMEIPSRAVLCDVVSQVKWAGVNRDYSRYHYDKEYAVGMKLPSAIVNGNYKVAQLAQFLIKWMGGGGTLKKLSWELRRMDIVGDTMTFRGTVSKCMKKDSEHLVECEVWAENPKGEKTVPGRALISLPSKSG